MERWTSVFARGRTNGRARRRPDESGAIRDASQGARRLSCTTTYASENRTSDGDSAPRCGPVADQLPQSRRRPAKGKEITLKSTCSAGLWPAHFLPVDLE